MRLNEMKIEVARLAGMDDDASCEQIVMAISRRIVDLEQAPVAAWEQVDQLNDRINELHREITAAKTNAHTHASERQRLEDRLLKIGARFEVIYEIIDSIDDIR